MARPPPSKSSGGSSSCGLVIAAILAFLLAGSVGFLIWQMLQLEQKFSEVAEACGKETSAIKLYPGFFRTSQEQEQFARLRSLNLNISWTFKPTGCALDCGSVASPTSEPNSTTTRGPIRIPTRLNLPPLPRTGGPFSDFLFHSCCSSGKRYVTPERVKNLLNVEKQVVQLDTYKQYFLEESCDQDTSCKGCTCVQPEPFIYQAVVYKDRNAVSGEYRFQIESIKLPGSCKCVNM